LMDKRMLGHWRVFFISLLAVATVQAFWRKPVQQAQLIALLVSHWRSRDGSREHHNS
jgi:hypothetical protein